MKSFSLKLCLFKLKKILKKFWRKSTAANDHENEYQVPPQFGQQPLSERRVEEATVRSLEELTIQQGEAMREMQRTKEEEKEEFQSLEQNLQQSEEEEHEAVMDVTEKENKMMEISRIHTNMSAIRQQKVEETDQMISQFRAEMQK